MATHSSTLAWKIPWTEESVRLQSMGVAKNWTCIRGFTFTLIYVYIYEYIYIELPAQLRGVFINQKSKLVPTVADYVY